MFYAGLLHSEYFLWKEMKAALLDLPDGVFIYVPFAKGNKWYLKDLTPVYKDDIPNELKVQLLLRGYSQ